MKLVKYVLAILALFVCTSILAELTNIAEDDASQSAYGGSWDSGKNGGSGFEPWTLASEGSGEGRYSGFFIADTKTNQDLNGITKNNKAFGMYANGSGFEQAVAYRAFEKPLQVGDSFSFLMDNGQFEKKFDKDDPTPGSIGIVLRTSNANGSIADYNKNATFEFGYYQGKGTYQIYDGNESLRDIKIRLPDSVRGIKPSKPEEKDAYNLKDILQAKDAPPTARLHEGAIEIAELAPLRAVYLEITAPE